jgi:hypothetical protein
MIQVRNVIAASAVVLAAGCSSVEVIEPGGERMSDSCGVQVFQTRRQAEKLGEIEELCIIQGTSAFSFSHTVATAIDKHKHKACSCGASRVFIESRRESGLEVATVTMIAFRVVKPAK